MHSGTRTHQLPSSSVTSEEWKNNESETPILGKRQLRHVASCFTHLMNPNDCSTFATTPVCLTCGDAIYDVAGARAALTTQTSNRFLLHAHHATLLSGTGRGVARGGSFVL